MFFLFFIRKTAVGIVINKIVDLSLSKVSNSIPFVIKHFLLNIC